MKWLKAYKTSLLLIEVRLVTHASQTKAEYRSHETQLFIIMKAVSTDTLDCKCYQLNPTRLNSAAKQKKNYYGSFPDRQGIKI